MGDPEGGAGGGTSGLERAVVAAKMGPGSTGGNPLWLGPSAIELPCPFPSLDNK